MVKSMKDMNDKAASSVYSQQAQEAQTEPKENTATDSSPKRNIVQKYKALFDYKSPKPSQSPENEKADTISPVGDYPGSPTQRIRNRTKKLSKQHLISKSVKVFESAQPSAP